MNQEKLYMACEIYASMHAMDPYRVYDIFLNGEDEELETEILNIYENMSEFIDY